MLGNDLAGGTTDLIYPCFTHCGSFTAGGSHVTNDILVTNTELCEALRKREGTLTDGTGSQYFDPFRYAWLYGKMVRAVTLNTIIQARMEEIFERYEDVEEFC